MKRLINPLYENSDSLGGAGDIAGGNDWLPLQPISIDPSKENQSPISKITPSMVKSLSKSSKKFVKQLAGDEDIEAEMEKIEKEIRLLNARLEVLRVRKAEKDLRVASSRRGRIVPAKFMEQKPSPACKKMEESPAIGRLQRRGFSLGPLEIHGFVAKSCFNKLEGIKEEETPAASPPKKVAGWASDSSNGCCSRRRGQSLGPAEIAAGARSRLPRKLQGIEEGRRKEMRQSSSVSPRSRKPAMNNIAELRNGIATVGAKKLVKREEDASSAGFKPKALFHEEQNPSSRKKTMKNSKVRIVASRYSLAAARCQEPESKRRKWSLPEPGKEEIELESFGESNEPEPEPEPEPSIVESSSPQSMVKIAAMLPKIRTTRGMVEVESPRDSGRVKRLAQLQGRKSHFAMEDDGEENTTMNFE